jgi:2-oxoglutarate dehydrogenase E2 component (dihydrolipoamide succinyltransferase)
MAVNLKVPEMGESVSEVYIGQWQKKEGDRVEQDDALVEIESEKATLDLRAPTAGVLTKILKSSGDAAEVGEVIGHIDESAGNDKRVEKTTAPEKAAPVAEKKEAKEVKPDAGESVKKPPADSETTQPESTPKPPPKEVLKQSDATVAKKGKAESEAKRPPEQKQEKSVEKPKAPPSATASDESDSFRGEKRVPMTPIRRRIASRLVEAQQNAALLTTFNEADMSAVKRLRAQHGDAFEKRHQVRLGFMSFFVKAAIEALRQCPELNAMIDGDDLVYRNYFDIGVAISSEKGLVVPVLRNAEQMSFAKIEQSIGDLSTRARGGELKVEELQGGTFTITNGGVFGSLLSTPIVNPPQAGVLGMHTIQERPVAVDGQVVVRPMMYIALTYDHRIVDGKEAVTFLRRIKEAIEEPSRLLLEV